MCVLVQVLLPGALSGLTATLSTLAGELSRSDSEDTLEEQAAELLKLPRKLEDVCAQLCEKLQKVPLPALGQVAAPLGSLAPFAFQQASHKCCRRPHSLHCDSTLWKRRGGAFCPQGPTKARCHTIWLLVPLVGCRPRLSQRVPVHGPEVVLKLITSNDPPPVNIRVVVGKAAATSAAYRPQPGTSPLQEFCELQTLMLRNLDQVQL